MDATKNWALFKEEKSSWIVEMRRTVFAFRLKKEMIFISAVQSVAQYAE